MNAAPGSVAGQPVGQTVPPLIFTGSQSEAGTMSIESRAELPRPPDTEHSSLTGAASGEGTIVPPVLHAQGKYATGIRFHHDTKGPTLRQREYSLML